MAASRGVPWRRHAGLLGIALASIVSLPGCIFGAVADSCEVDTSDLVVQAHVVDDDGLIRASAEFRVGFTRVELCDEDVLTVNGIEATEVSKSLSIEYGVNWDPEEGVEDFVFVLARNEEDVDIGEVSLPPRFAIMTPESGSQSSRAVPLGVTWDPPWAEHDINLRVEDELAGPCSVVDGAPDYAEGIDVADTGSHDIDAGTFEYSEILGTDGTCQAFVELRRTVAAEVSQALDSDSELTARVRRQVDFVLIP